MADFYRTPDHAFDGLVDFSYAPHYLEWDGLRTHYVDEGPKEAPVALLLHGEPTWSYLYRKMIPPLLAAGYRCVAPDYIGFGRSDKVLDDRWYVIDRHIERLAGLIERLDLNNITVFVQDWGGPIGLINAVASPDRFSRLAILNTWLHHNGCEYGPGIRAWREAATNRHWLAWMRHDLPVGAIVRRSCVRPVADVVALEAAYEAPYLGSVKAKAGARRFPWCIPFAEPEAGAAERQAQAFEALKNWSKPVHVIFGADDPIFTPAWGEKWAGMIPGATFDTVDKAGHFCQEDAGEDIIARLLKRIAGPN
ncbi:MAG: alpha/beta hydrolase [Alcaligenaceae bacterium]|nr:MAG: alpha/beta hydrolase [Alcaligenaceae bacterium]